MARSLLKLLGYGLLLLLVLLVILYAVFLGLMTITEKRWLGDAPFHAAIDSRSVQPHELTLIDGGAQSLAYRLSAIEAAKQSLDLEFFIYELDASSRIVTQALVAKAREGVRVRILVDFSVAVFELRPAYAQALESAGVDVRYYNTASVARFFSVQHRTHRKMLIADGEIAIIGGRNIADPYFDLSGQYNFLDSDVLVRGEVVQAMQESFDLYWDSPWAEIPDDVAPPAKTDNHPALRKASTFFATNESDAALRQRVGLLPADLPSHICSDVRFVTDYPGVGLQNRKVYGAITEVLGGAQSQVIAESPYFVLREDGLNALRSLTERGVALTVLTNSLHSTDAYYTVGPLYFSLHTLADAGLRLFAYTGQAPQTTAQFPGSKRWGVHSKRAVIDDHTVMIGTYNIDPRSANLNAEMMIVCYDSPSLATQMAIDLNSRIANAEPVVDRGEVQSSNLIGAANWRSLALMGLVTPVASLFNVLL
ncbi:MAG: phospholipase D-like domain-containing protein [Pseudomonadales bacterium]